MSTRACAYFLTGTTLSCCASIAAADGLPADVQGATVIVGASGADTTQGNAPVVGEATGFVINTRYGWIVTAYHLIENLGAGVIGPQLYVQTKRIGGTKVSAVDVFHSEAADVMVVYAPISQLGLKELTQGDPDSENVSVASTPIYDPGYPAGLDYNISQGFITSWNGPLNPLIPAWTTNLTFKEGQSGSPIVLTNGHVIAFARGVDQDATELGYVIPARYIPQQYWDGTARVAANQNVAQLAATRVVIKATTIADLPKAKSIPVEFANERCAAPKNESRVIAADAGWEVIPSSAKVTELSAQADSHATIDAAGGGGVVVSSSLANTGTCSLFDSWFGGGDVPAQLKAMVDYVERPVDVPHTTVTVASAAALPQSTVQLPTSAAPLQFSVVKPDGSAVSFVPQKGELTVLNGHQSIDVSRVVARVLK